MNINDFPIPFDWLPSDNFDTDSATAADVTITVPDGIILAIEAAYDMPPGANAQLQIIDGGTTKKVIPITNDGAGSSPHLTPLKPAFQGTPGRNVDVVLTSGGGGVTGYLNVASCAQNTPPGLVQQATASGNGNALPALADPTEAGHSLILTAAFYTPTLTNADGPWFQPVTIPAGDAVGRMTLALEYATIISVGPPVEAIVVGIWYLHDITAGLGNVGGVPWPRAYSGADNVLVANLSEWFNLENQAPTVTGGQGGTSSGIVVTDSITPTDAQSIIIAAGGWGGGGADDFNGYQSGPANSFTRMTDIGVSTDFSPSAFPEPNATYLESAYLLTSDLGNYLTRWNLMFDLNWATAIAAFASSNPQ